MRGKKYSFIGILIVLIMTVLLFSACTDQETSNGDPGDSEEPFSFSVMVSTFAEVPNMENDFWTRFQEENNIDLDIEWIPDGEFSTVLDLRLSSDDLTDVVSIQNPHDNNVVSAINDGVFWDLGPFLDEGDYPNLENNIPEEGWRYTEVDGTHYYLPRSRAPLNMGGMIRRDLLDELDLSVPETVDELHAVLKEVIDNDDGDLVGMLFTEHLQFAFGAHDPEYNDEGGMYHQILTDAYTDMVEWYREVYEDGLMSEEFATITNHDEIFEAGTTVFHVKNMWHQYRFNEGVQRAYPDAEVEIIPFLEGPGGYSLYLEPGFTGGIFFPTDVPEERLLQLLDIYDLAASEENSLALFRGYEGTHYNVDEHGELVSTDQGLSEMQSFTNDPFTILRDEWDKVDSPLAPSDVNIANREIAEAAYDVLEVNPFRVMNSLTWSRVWPQHVDHFERVRTQAIMGDITMDEYREYIQEIREDPQLQEAFQEFAEEYPIFFEE